MGNRGVGEHPLDIVLPEGKQVAGQHGGNGDDGKDEHDLFGPIQVGHGEEPKQYGHHGAFGYGGDKGADWGGGAFVDVGRPHMEGDQG